MRALICTTNSGKIKEFKDKLSSFHFFTLKEEDIFIDIAETGNTFEDNALLKLDTILKAHPYLMDKYDLILAEDSGLCVDILDGAPGIYSARYGGEHGNDILNNNRLLANLEFQTNRRAHYEACIAAFFSNTQYTFTGKVLGTISLESKGENGFGYDPLFIPGGYVETFGELDNTIKMKISHRANAIELMMNALRLE